MSNNLLPLPLSVKVKNWRNDSIVTFEADTEFAQVKPKILERDRFSCRACGFKLPKTMNYLQVHHKDDDHANNDPNNLVTICMHCHACFHIGFWGQNRGMGQEAIIIWLPEMTQAQISHIFRTVMVARKYYETVSLEAKSGKSTVRSSMSDNKIENAKLFNNAANNLFDKLRSREEKVVAELGTSNPSEIANILLQLPNERYDERNKILGPMRLLPLGPHVSTNKGKDIMPEIVSAWLTDAGNPYNALNPSSWMSFAKNA